MIGIDADWERDWLQAEKRLRLQRRRFEMARKMKPDDPAYWMLFDGVTTTPVVYNEGCYICNDDEYAQMGLPLCRKCPKCDGHIPADMSTCDDCGYDEYETWCARQDPGFNIVIVDNKEVEH